MGSKNLSFPPIYKSVVMWMELTACFENSICTVHKRNISTAVIKAHNSVRNSLRISHPF